MFLNRVGVNLSSRFELRPLLNDLFRSSDEVTRWGIGVLKTLGGDLSQTYAVIAPGIFLRRSRWISLDDDFFGVSSGTLRFWAFAEVDSTFILLISSELQQIKQIRNEKWQMRKQITD